MAQLLQFQPSEAPLLRADPPVSPLLLSDRLIALAEQAQLVGCTATASRLVRLASTVLGEKTGFAPPPRQRTQDYGPGSLKAG